MIFRLRPLVLVSGFGGAPYSLNWQSESMKAPIFPILLFCLCFGCFICLGSAAAADTFTALQGLVRPFIQQRLRGGEVFTMRRNLQCGLWDRLLEINASNTNFAGLESHFDRCPKPHYFPRTLSTNQISWKSRPKTESLSPNASSNETLFGGNCTSDAVTGNSSVPENGACVNGTWVKVDANTTSPLNSESSSNNGSKSTQEIVHRFLAFAILLPQHPFSSDMLESLRMVAPMFPDITIVIGSGHDFVDFCAQYNVRSFPKLLFFNQGLLKHKFKGEHNPWDLAQQLTSWTQSLPRAAPDPGTAYKWLVPPLSEHQQTKSSAPRLALPLHIHSYINRTEAAGYGRAFAPSATLSTRFWQMIGTRTFEPLGATSALGVHEPRVTLVAGVFVVCHLAYKAFSVMTNQ